MDERVTRLMARIRDVPDFPKAGILFKDITPLLGDAAAFQQVIALLAERAEPRRPDVIVGIESRGFIFGSALAARLGRGFVPVRKAGKLPYKTVRETYALEYGTDTLEIHEDGVPPGARALIVDDLLATGGTAGAAARLVERQGGSVGAFAFVIELGFLGGRARLGDRAIDSLIVY